MQEVFNYIYKTLYLCLGGIGIVAGTQFMQGYNKLATSKLEKHNIFKKNNTGVKISEHITLSNKDTKEGTIVIAPTGVGKTRRVIVPNLFNNALKGSFVVLDMKGELYDDTSEHQRNLGRKVIKLNPLSENSASYNPLEECANEKDVTKLAQNLLINGSLSNSFNSKMDSEWITMATPLLTSILLYGYYKGGNYRNIPFLLDKFLNDKNFNKEIKKVDKAYKHYQVFMQGERSEKTIDSIKITLSTNLSLYLDNQLRRNILYSSFKIEQLRKESTALYIQINPEDAKYLSPFTAILFYQMFNKLFTYKTGLPIYFFMDEFTNIGYIQNFNSIASIGRAYNLNLVCCIQDMSQLKQLYGEDITLTILNNLKTKLVLNSLTDIYTLEYLSKLLGETKVQVVSSSNSIKNSSTTYTPQKRNLFTIDEIRRLKDNEVLIISKNKYPVIDYMCTTPLAKA